MRVDQVIPTLASRDAIGVHTVELTRALRSAGIESDIYYADATPDVAHQGRPISDLGRHRRDRWILYQASIGHPVFDLVMERSEPKLVNYHNITPVKLLQPWEPIVGYVLGLGRSQLRVLAPVTKLAIAVSGFNQRELLELGYRRTEVVPLLIDMHVKAPQPDPSLTHQLMDQRSRGGADLLFVGKVSPHKAPHDLVAMLALYREMFDPAARLRLVGQPLSSRYQTALLAFIGRLGLSGAVTVAGSVTEAELEAFYRNADVFVCASEHEGFCVPLIEAMGHGLPVVAYGSTAIPETVREAGLMLDDKRPLPFALAVNRLMEEPLLRARLAAAGRRRAEAFTVDRSRRQMVDVVLQAVA